MQHALDFFLGQILGNQRNVEIGTDLVIGSLIFKPSILLTSARTCETTALVIYYFKHICNYQVSTNC